jgi:hypothetical protein
MGGRPVVLLRGHGLAAAGASVPEAVLRAISVDTIAGLALTVVAAGGRLVDIPDDDWADLPDLGPGFTEAWAGGTSWPAWANRDRQPPPWPSVRPHTGPAAHGPCGVRGPDAAARDSGHSYRSQAHLSEPSAWLVCTSPSDTSDFQAPRRSAAADPMTAAGVIAPVACNAHNQAKFIHDSILYTIACSGREPSRVPIWTDRSRNIRRRSRPRSP